MTRAVPTSPPVSYRLRKSQKLLNSSDFTPVFNDAPIRASHPQVLMLCRPNDLGFPRVGLVVGKKNVRKACQRNTFKRVARESFRLKQHNLPAIDAIVLARRGADGLSRAELRQILDSLWKRVAKRARKHNEQPG